MNTMIERLQKGLATFGCLLLLTISVKAADSAVVCPFNTYTNILSTNAIKVSQFTIANATGTNTYIQFNDSSSTNQFVTNNSYSFTNYVFNATVTNIYTNYFGVLTTNIYAALVAQSNFVPANTNYVPIIFAATVPANTTYQFNGLWRFLNGAVATNGLGAVTVSFTYTQ